MNFEIAIDNKLCNFIYLYRSPSQNKDEFESFVKHFDLNLEYVFNRNPFLTLFIGDFNARSHNWYADDKTT